jgi:diadenosine tetraphosphate (Ap4A) HIT family hydrolase
MSCPFCDKNDEDVQERILFKDDLIVAFPTNTPIVPGHILVCPSRHVSKIDELTEKEFKALRDFIIKLKNSLKKTFQAEGFNIAWNESEIAGQSVSHLHIHVVPRKEGDKGIYKYEPRKFLYRPGSRKESSTEELKKVSELVKSNL